MKTYKELKALVDKKDEEIKKAKIIRNRYFNELRKVCPHKNKVEKKSYFEGSYFDHAHTDYWDECTCCGKILNERTKTHNWYG